MSCEQISLSTIDVFKPWMGVNSVLTASQVFIATQDDPMQPGKKIQLYQMPTSLPNPLKSLALKSKASSINNKQSLLDKVLEISEKYKDNGNKLRIKSKAKESALERAASSIAPLWFLSPDEFNNLSFVEYTEPPPPPAPVAVLPYNYNTFYKTFNITQGNPFVSTLENHVPYFYYCTQSPSQLSDTAYTSCLLQTGIYTLTLNQYNTGTSGAFAISFVDAAGNQSLYVEDFNAALGLNTYTYNVYAYVGGCCFLNLTCYGSTSGGYDSNLIDLFISYTGFQPPSADKEATLGSLKAKALQVSKVSQLLPVSVFPHVKVSHTSDSQNELQNELINSQDELKKE